MNNFLIIGTSRSGTSLLHSIVNSHSQITCDFESTNWMKGDRTRQEQANGIGEIFGNKMPIEILFQHGWEADDVVKLIEEYLIINTLRQRTIYCDRMVKSGIVDYLTAVDRWDLNNQIYHSMLEIAPDRVLRVAYPDLCLRPSVEVGRIFRFLGVDITQLGYCLSRGPQKIKLYPQQDGVLKHKAFISNPNIKEMHIRATVKRG